MIFIEYGIIWRLVHNIATVAVYKIDVKVAIVIGWYAYCRMGEQHIYNCVLNIFPPYKYHVVICKWTNVIINANNGSCSTVIITV